MANLDVTKLDFDDIKSSLKDFLQSQEKYKDYDFEGSNLSILLDILSYNTHYNQLYTNFALNEVFIDSAAKRDSVVSLAKGLGYTPRSSTSSKAVVDITVTNVSSGAPQLLVLQSGSRFISNVNDEQYTFTTISPYTAQLISGSYSFDNVSLLQGELLTNTYIYNEGTRIVIPNLGCDLSTLRVKIQESSSSSNFTIFNSVNNITESNFESSVYFVKEVENGLYEIYFGENVIGKQPVNGNIITIEYMSGDGEIPNGAKSFTYNGQSLANGLVSVTTVEAALSGKDREDIESIRLNAPNSFAAQNRAVNPLDYETIIRNNIPNLDSISVWGGEDNIPRVYGKVFLSVKPTGREKLSTQEKKSILSLLKDKRVVAITPEFIDPDLLYILINSTVYYNPATTNKTVTEIELLVRETISDYNTKYLNNSKGRYKHSVLSTLIDKSDKSILNNSTEITLQKKFLPVLNANYSTELYIHNPIVSLFSTPFYIEDQESQVYIRSSGSNLILYRLISSGEESLGSIGSIDSVQGIITINNTVITSTASQDNSITLTITPDSDDISSMLNQIVSVDVASSIVNVIQESSNYIFTSNRI